jgi:hypothetical protein
MLLFNYQNVYQPIIALLFIIIRELNGWIVSKFITKIASGDEPGAQFVGSSVIGISNTVMIFYQVGSSATLETSYFIMGLDFAINIYLTLRIVWVRKRRSQDIEKHIDLVEELARNELIEFLAPLAFVIVFVVAYYGPNSRIFGGVGVTIWQFVAIEDIKETMGIFVAFFFIDFCSGVVSSIILWVFCKFNLFKAIIVLQKEWGVVICVVLGFFVITVSKVVLCKLIFIVISI